MCLNIQWLCIIIFIVICILGMRNVSCEVGTESNSWTVEFYGQTSIEEVNRIADENGFVNKGKVFADKEIYEFFVKTNTAKPLIKSLFRKDKDFLTNISNLPNSTRVAENLLVKTVIQQKKYPRVLRYHSGSSDEDRFNDPYWYSLWYLKGEDPMNVQKVWDRGITGKGVTVSVVDGGIQKNHTDLSPNYDSLASYDFIDHDNDPTETFDLTISDFLGIYGYYYAQSLYQQAKDDAAHGTMCAGVIAAVANNKKCAVGVAYNSSIGGIRVVESSMTDMDEGRALSFARDVIDIYSNSWGPSDDGRSVNGPQNLANIALEMGVSKGRKGRGNIYIFSAGNGGEEEDSCAYDGYMNSIYTIAISSVKRFNSKPAYTERCSTIMAVTYSGSKNYYGSHVTTTYLNDGCTSDFTGTSASAPLASGIVALALQANSNLTWRDVQYTIMASSNPNPLLSDGEFSRNAAGRMFSDIYGFGLMDAQKLVDVATGWKKSVPEQMKTSHGPYDMSYNIDSYRSKGGKKTFNISVPDCQDGSDNCTRYLEHVQLIMSITSMTAYRGGISVNLTSPSGTISKMFYKRGKDTGSESFNKWPVTSLKFWGEKAEGNWVVSVEFDTGSSRLTYNSITITYIELVVYGVSTNPFDDNKIQFACNSRDRCSKVNRCDPNDPSHKCHECMVDQYYHEYERKCVPRCIDHATDSEQRTCKYQKTTTTTTTRNYWSQDNTDYPNRFNTDSSWNNKDYPSNSRPGYTSKSSRMSVAQISGISAGSVLFVSILISIVRCVVAKKSTHGQQPTCNTTNNLGMGHSNLAYAPDGYSNHGVSTISRGNLTSWQSVVQ